MCNELVLGMCVVCHSPNNIIRISQCVAGYVSENLTNSLADPKYIHTTCVSTCVKLRELV